MFKRKTILCVLSLWSVVMLLMPVEPNQVYPVPTEPADEMVLSVDL